MLTAYVAGPYRSDTIYGIKRNIRAAEEATERLIERGCAVICPHLITRFCDGLREDKWFLEAGLTLLKKCDFIVVLDGWERSEGTRAEMDLARSLNMPMFRLDALPDPGVLALTVEASRMMLQNGGASHLHTHGEEANCQDIRYYQLQDILYHQLKACEDFAAQGHWDLVCKGLLLLRDMIDDALPVVESLIDPGWDRIAEEVRRQIG